MSVQSIPFHELFNPTLKALHLLGGSGRIQEIDDIAVGILKLSDEEIAELHKPGQSNQTRIAYRLAWARSWLKRYGLLENSSRGVWALTKEGTSTTEVDGKEVQRTVNEILKREKLLQSDAQTSETEVGEEVLSEDLDSSDEDDWRDTLFAMLKNMDATAFERLCKRDSA